MTARERRIGLVIGYGLYYGAAWPLILLIAGWAWRPERRGR